MYSCVRIFIGISACMQASTLVLYFKKKRKDINSTNHHGKEMKKNNEDQNTLHTSHTLALFAQHLTIFVQHQIVM